MSRKSAIPILIVDDYPANLLALEALLEPLGLEIVRASSGAEAVDLAARRIGGFACVILDCLMPGMDGIETTIQIRQTVPEDRPVPVVMITAADVAPDMISRAYQAGVVDFLPKPIQPESLLAKVGVFVELYVAKMALERTDSFMRAVVNASPEIIHVYDLQKKRNLYINRELARALGYESGQLADYEIQGFDSIVHPDDMAGYRESLERMLYASNHSVQEDEYRVRHADGTWRWLCSRKTVFNRRPDGTVRSIVTAIRDITDAKAQREELKHVNSFFSVVLENVNSGILACDAEGSLSLFNRSTRELFGLPADPVPAEQWGEYYDVFHADGEVLMRAEETPLMRALRGETVRDVGIIIAPHNQPRRTVITNGMQLRDKTGSVLGAVVAMHDVTALVESERQTRRLNEELEQRVLERTRELAASEGRFRLMADSAPALIWMTDKDRKLVFFNKPWLEFTGRTLEEEICCWHENAHPEDFPLCADTFEHAFDEKQPFRVEYRLRRHDGEWRWLMDHGVPLSGADGEFIGYIGSCIDITERKHAEQLQAEKVRLAALGTEVAAALVGSFSLRDTLQKCAEAVVTHLNAALARIWSLNDMVGILELEASAGIITQLEGPHYRVPIGRRIVGHIAQERKPYLTNAVQDDPRFRDLEWAKNEGVTSFAGYPMIVENRVVGVIAMFGQYSLSSEVHQALESIATGIGLGIVQKHAEAQLRQVNSDLETARDQALDASRAKSTFLANMSHELRTPLNAVIGYAELLREEMLGNTPHEKLVEDIGRVESAGRHLLSLINDVLDLSKIEAGRMELILEEVRIAELIYSSVATINPLIKKNANRVEVHCEGTEDIALILDRTRLMQILFNLLSNAAKFTENGTITVHSAITVDIAGSSWLEISVGDTGLGMSSDQVMRLFQKFQQLDASPTRRHSGSGLGLVICRHLCTLMGGSIDVQSDPEKGSVFTVILPARRSAH